MVETDNGFLTISFCIFDGARGKLIGRAGGMEALCDVTSTIVDLQEKPSPVCLSGRQTSMPDIRDKKANIAGTSDQRFYPAPVVLQILIAQLVSRRCLAGLVATWYDASRSVVIAAVL